MINGKRVRLRPMTIGDAPDVVRWRNDPFVSEHLFGDGPPTLDSHVQWFEQMQARGDRQEFIIVERATGRAIGTIGLSAIDRGHRRAEYGILIGEAEARGQGYAREASQLLLEYAFNELQLHRVYLLVFADHMSALGLYVHLGFQIEGTLRGHVFKRGVFRDVIEMAILNPVEIL
jgi:UDP-4-amino-4,6-dideoxy-N-acetyl-beta-L-altrosamine N-acetyltransferase